MRLIDGDELYKRTAEWEEQAQDEVNKNKGCRTVEEWDKYKEWLIILNERSSFKYDIADAPTIDIDSIAKAHEDMGYEQGYRDECAEAESKRGFEVVANEACLKGRGGVMTVCERIELLKAEIAKLSEKYCENCQEWTCENCWAKDEVGNE